jgi:hypothetical protein
MEAVGIGCFWFARSAKAVENDPEDYFPGKHLADIKAALEGVDSVSNVNIVGEGNRTKGFWMPWMPHDEDEDEDEENRREPNLYPVYSGVFIQFDIFIPKRLQERYMHGRKLIPIENFRIDIFFDHGMPLALVHYPVNANEDELRKHYPSTAVVCVRKYLEEKLREHPVVEFQSLGPSPFWADVFLTKRDDSKPLAEDLTLPGDGYRTIVIRVDGTTREKKIIEFVSEYEPILATFYDATLIRQASASLRHKLTTGAQRLLDANSGGNIWTRFNIWRRFGKKIDKVYSDLLTEKLYRSRGQYFADEILQDEQVLPDNIFWSFVEREITDRSDVPDEDIRELLIMLEERRRGYFANTATLLAGLAGAVLGAVITAGATFGLNSSTPVSPHPEQTSVTRSSTD